MTTTAERVIGTDYDGKRVEYRIDWYSTRAAAVAGHDQMCARVRDSLS